MYNEDVILLDYYTNPKVAIEDEIKQVKLIANQKCHHYYNNTERFFDLIKELKKSNTIWDTFTSYDEYPLSRLDIVFDDIESFVKKICVDEMGKEALKDKIAAIHLTNSENNDDVKMELKDETLFLTVQLVQSSFNSQTDSQLAAYVEALL